MNIIFNNKNTLDEMGVGQQMLHCFKELIPVLHSVVKTRRLCYVDFTLLLKQNGIVIANAQNRLLTELGLIGNQW